MWVTDGSLENAEMSVHCQPGGQASALVWQLMREHILSAPAQVGAAQPLQSLSCMHMSPKPS
jgi:hypothetical protein